MKVKAIVNIDDKQDKVFRPVGSIFECDEERAKYLLKHKAVEIIELKKAIIEVDSLDEMNKPKKKKHSKK